MEHERGTAVCAVVDEVGELGYKSVCHVVVCCISILCNSPVNKK